MKKKRVVERWSGPGSRDGTIRPPAASDNAAHPSPMRHYFEHWYFDAVLPDGHVVVGFLQAAELVTRKPGVELHVYEPSGRRISESRTYSPADVTAEVDRFDVHIGENHGYTEHGVSPAVHRIHLAEGDMEFDLEFANEVPFWKPGEGRTEYGADSFFAWVVPAPRARVRGTVRYSGNTLEVDGRGYHDHNWGVGDMKRIVSYWYWGRVYADEYTLLYAYVMPRRAFGCVCSRPVMLAREDRILLSTGEVTLDEGPRVFNAAGNRDYPSDLTLEAPGELVLRLKVREVIDAHNFLDDLGGPFRRKAVQRVVNRMVGRPGYFRFRSDFELEVLLGDGRDKRVGSTLHEMVALQ